MDGKLSKAARGAELSYSRYADDLTFSGRSIPTQFVMTVEAILRDEGFRARKDKTRKLGPRAKKIVTGISISGSEIRVPRAYKRAVRQEAYYVSRFGYSSVAAKFKIPHPSYFQSLFGKVTFIASVEPENDYFSKLKRTLHEL
jgi:hypothetical protein